jgi:ABC-type Mn2+/Zn2+ transport system permease subunit
MRNFGVVQAVDPGFQISDVSLEDAAAGGAALSLLGAGGIAGAVTGLVATALGVSLYTGLSKKKVKAKTEDMLYLAVPVAFALGLPAAVIGLVYKDMSA